MLVASHPLTLSRSLSFAECLSLTHPPLFLLLPPSVCLSDACLAGRASVQGGGDWLLKRPWPVPPHTALLSARADAAGLLLDMGKAQEAEDKARETVKRVCAPYTYAAALTPDCSPGGFYGCNSGSQSVLCIRSQTSDHFCRKCRKPTHGWFQRRSSSGLAPEVT